MKKISSVIKLDFSEVLARYLPIRNREAHKGDFGHVFVIGGDKGFSGAVRLAGEAAYRVGAGLVTVLTHPDHAAMLNITRPELMCRGISRASEIKKSLDRATVVILGPGLGHSDWGKALFKAFFRLNIEVPVVLDA